MPDFLLYRLQWDATKGKYKKTPCRLDGQSLSKGETPPHVARDVATAALAKLPAHEYVLGMWIAPPMFFIDLDECVVDGALTAEAAALVQPFLNAGCYFEWSVSGTGAHVLGRYSGELPAHDTQRPSLHKHGFYLRDRGCVMSSGPTVGSWDVDATALLHAMLPTTFPARAATDALPVGERRPEWRGPEDDDVLIQRALTARGSARAQFGNTWTFADLWSGNVPEDSRSEADLAMASHLAFWTGCDVPRIERIMRKSALCRPKWNEHRTYLIDKTITHACATTRTVYQEPQRVDTLAALAGTTPPAVSGELLPIATTDDATDWFTITDDTIAAINNTGTLQVLLSDVIPRIAPLGLPAIHAQRVVNTLAKRFELFNARMPIADVRSIVTPPVSASLAVAPDWLASICYVKQTDRYYNTVTGSEYSAEGLRVEYNRMMPQRPSGEREDVVKWARDRWNIVTVDNTGYRPDKPPYYDYGGKQFANTFRMSTLPALTTASDEATKCIAEFQLHLWYLCGKREDVYIAILSWLAFNVRYPGIKVRWSPLIKGVPGDGKSILGELLREVLGVANVKMTSINTLSNSGGFTDWARGAAVNVIEEIRLEGKEKRKLFNAMKIFIGDRNMEINAKGKVSSGGDVNVTNHIAFTNYGDALPIEDGERRWLVVFSPYSDIDDLMKERAIVGTADLVRYFNRLGESMRAEPGAWRAWLTSMDVSGFDHNGRALDTPERASMKLMSSDSMDEIVVDIIEQGAHGITKQCFSSSCLAGQVKVRAGDRPHDRGWNSLLTRLGYQQLPKPVWWSGALHRIWAKKAITNEQAREILTGTQV